jgi:diguanylate cyclase
VQRLNGLIAAVETLFTLGCQHCHTKTQERKVIQVNCAVVIAMATLLIFNLVFFMVGNKGLIISGLVQSPFFVLFPLVLRLNAKGKFFLARWALFLLVMADVCAALMLAQGVSLRIHYYFLMFAILPASFFTIEEWRSTALLGILNLVIFSYFQRYGWPAHPDIGLLTDLPLHLLQTFMIGSCAIIVLLIILLSERYTEINERELQHQANTDQLTGLFNRRYFMRAFSHAQARHPHSCLLFLDIDHFKRINDTGGHHAGDGALCHISMLLSSQVQSPELLARIGGEEFAILLLPSSRTPYLERARQIKESLQNSHFNFDGTHYQITVSIGMTEIGHYQPEYELIRQADSALYLAKLSGRNCIRQYTDVR